MMTSPMLRSPPYRASNGERHGLRPRGRSYAQQSKLCMLFTRPACSWTRHFKSSLPGRIRFGPSCQRTLTGHRTQATQGAAVEQHFNTDLLLHRDAQRGPASSVRSLTECRELVGVPRIQHGSRWRLARQVPGGDRVLWRCILVFWKQIKWHVGLPRTDRGVACMPRERNGA